MYYWAQTLKPCIQWISIGRLKNADRLGNRPRAEVRREVLMTVPVLSCTLLFNPPGAVLPPNRESSNRSCFLLQWEAREKFFNSLHWNEPAAATHSWPAARQVMLSHAQKMHRFLLPNATQSSHGPRFWWPLPVALLRYAPGFPRAISTVYKLIRNLKEDYFQQSQEAETK